MNLANKITLLRVALVPVFIAMFFVPFPHWYLGAAALFVFAFFTDMVDGKIARARNEVTNFGKFMDPIADKMLSMSALVMLCASGFLHDWFPVAAIVIIAREFAVSALRLVAAGEGTVIAASWLGKAKTVTQFIAITAALLLPGFSEWLGGWYAIVVDVLIVVAVLITIWSGWDYMAKNWQAIDYRK